MHDQRVRQQEDSKHLDVAHLCHESFPFRSKLLLFDSALESCVVLGVEPTRVHKHVNKYTHEFGALGET